jgi:hypothetical protein
MIVVEESADAYTLRGAELEISFRHVGEIQTLKSLRQRLLHVPLGFCDAVQAQ